MDEVEEILMQNPTKRKSKKKKIQQDLSGSEETLHETEQILIQRSKKKKLKKNKINQQDLSESKDCKNQTEPTLMQKSKKQKLKKRKIRQQELSESGDIKNETEQILMQVSKKKKLKSKKNKIGQQELSGSEIGNSQFEELLLQGSNNATVDNIEHSSNPAEKVDMSTSKLVNKKKGILIQRSEASQNISEFNLSEVGKKKVQINELIKVLKPSSRQLLTKGQLKNEKTKTLSVPLCKPEQEKIKRKVAYDKVCDDIKKWDPVVEKNRVTDQVIFPLKQPELMVHSIENVAESFVTKSPLEEQIAKLLNKSEHVLNNEKTLTEAEEKALQAMSLEEAKLRHAELMKHRALISYKEAKARRQNKIKSRRYRRILKREKMRKMIKEFEELKKTDEAAAFEKLAEADKIRILERMTLKHRNTGKWAKQQKLRAKYNPESRSNLKEDLLLGRTLKEKLPVNLEEELKAKTTSRITLCGKTEIDSGNLIENNTSFNDFITSEIEILPSGSDEDETNSEFQETSYSKKITSREDFSKGNKVNKPSKSKKVSVESDVDFSTEVKFLDSMVPDDITAGDEDIDDAPEGAISIRQAFADEGLIAEFQEERKIENEANTPQGIDLYLPGWGSWGGPGIQPSERKRSRFFIKPVELPPKKDTLGNVIVNEEKDKKTAAHQVSDVPFPFSTVHQFESYIRQPVGNTWNPETSFQNLIAPKVITKLGKIIDPIDAEDVVLEKKPEKRNAKLKRKAPDVVKAF